MPLLINKIRILVRNGRNDENSVYITSCALSLLEEMVESQPDEMRKKFGNHLFTCLQSIQDK